MKRIIAAILVIIMLASMIGCGNDDSISDLDVEGIEATEPVKYTVSVDVDCEENLIFSKYNVKVFAGSTEIGLLEHGEHQIFEIELEEGLHTVSFENEEDDEVQGTTQITVSSDETFKFKIACKNDHIEVILIETVNLSGQAEELVTAPSLGYIVECLKNVPSIIGIEVDLEDDSANFSGLAGSDGRIYFASDLVDQDNVRGDTVKKKGTSGGGSIDVFATVAEAEERNDYLMGYDDTWLDSGSHVVVGTIVIRISEKLSEEQQKELQSNIIEVLTSGEISEPESYESVWVAEGFDVEVTYTEPEATTEITTAPTEQESATETSMVSTEPPTPTEDTTSSTTPPDTTEPVDVWDGITLLTSDLSVRTQSDYAHTDTEVIFLGNNEGVTITITTSATGVTIDDLVILYDESLLNVRIDEPTTSGNQTVIKLYATGRTTCETEIVICTAYELAMYGDEASAYFFDVRKLNNTDGRVVYVTYSGDKYHFSKSCAGDSATETTYRDAVAYEYEPCGKCAK